MYTQDIVLLGGGGHCKSVLDTVIRNKRYKEIYVTDPHIPAGTLISGKATVIGSDKALLSLYEKGTRNAFITVGVINPSPIRNKLYTYASGLGFYFPNLFDPSAVISSSVRLGEDEKSEKNGRGGGIFVGKLAAINAEAVIGECCIINTAAVIEHECVVGAFTHISVGAILCGQVSVGYNSFIGAGSTVRQGVKIGNNVLVGANSLVLRDVKDGEKVVGIVK